MEGQYNLLPDSYPYEGKARKSECTCFLLFLVMLLLYAGVFIAGFYWDGPSLLLPYDSAGNICGSKALSTHPFLYFASPEYDLHYTVCVSQCPSDKLDFTCVPQHFVSECGKEFTYLKYEGENSTTPIYQTTPLWGSICYPEETLRVKLAGSDPILAWLMKIDPPHSAVDVILALMTNILVWVLPLGLCIAFFLLLRFMVNLVSGVVIVALFLIMVNVGWSAYFSEAAQTEGYSIAGVAGVLLFVLAGVFLISSVLLCKQIELAGVVIKLACSFLYSQFPMILVGAATYILVVAAISISVLLGAMTYYSGSVIRTGMQLFIPILEIDLKTTFLLMFEVQFALWILFFLLYFAHMVVIHGVVKWYYNTSTVIPLLQVLPSLLRTVPYIDQIAYGSLVQSLSLPLCFGVGSLLYYGGEALDSLQYKFAVQILLVVFWALAAGLVALTRFAMINIMTTDNPFPEAFSTAFLLFAGNPLRFVAYVVVMKGLTFFSWVGISYASVAFLDLFVGTMESPTIASLVSVISIAGSVLTVLEVFRSVADTLFMCFLQDMGTQAIDFSGRPLLAKDSLESFHSVPLT